MSEPCSPEVRLGLRSGEPPPIAQYHALKKVASFTSHTVSSPQSTRTRRADEPPHAASPGQVLNSSSAHAGAHARLMAPTSELVDSGLLHHAEEPHSSAGFGRLPLGPRNAHTRCPPRRGDLHLGPLGESAAPGIGECLRVPPARSGSRQPARFERPPPPEQRPAQHAGAYGERRQTRACPPASRQRDDERAATRRQYHDPHRSPACADLPRAPRHALCPQHPRPHPHGHPAQRRNRRPRRRLQRLIGHRPCP